MPHHSQPAGDYQITIRFAGDLDYLASTAAADFRITREQTALVYDGPAQVANDTPATLRATLKEDGITPIAGRVIDFTLGTGSATQTCRGTTGPDGQAQCTSPPSPSLTATRCQSRSRPASPVTASTSPPGPHPI